MKLTLVFVLLTAILFFWPKKQVAFESIEGPSSIFVENKTATEKKQASWSIRFQPERIQQKKVLAKKYQKRVRKKRSDETYEENWYQDTTYTALGSEAETFFLKASQVKRYFPKGPPKEINITRSSRTARFIHPNKKGLGTGKGKTLYVADQESVDDYVEKLAKDDPENEKEISKEDRIELAENSFRVEFEPGVMEFGRSELITVPNNVYERVSQVDFSLDEGMDEDVVTEIDPLKPEMSEAEKEALRRLSHTLLSLGHGGRLEAEIIGGTVLDLAGVDFIIFENPFKVKDVEYQRKFGLYFQEPAYVEVYSQLNGWQRFPCNLENLMAEGSFCAGTIPSDQGGNVFKIEWLKTASKEFKKIRVIDTGQNILPETLSREDAAGADIDAIYLENAFK